jgi:His-Xaa-Ser system protein HxsD
MRRTPLTPRTRLTHRIHPQVFEVPMVPASGDSGSCERNDVIVSFDGAQFSQEAVRRAAYWFTRDWDIEFVPMSHESTITVVLRPKNAKSGGMPSSIAGDFRCAVLDAQLRLEISRETAGIRELILAKAFAEAGVLEPGEE